MAREGGVVVDASLATYDPSPMGLPKSSLRCLIALSMGVLGCSDSPSTLGSSAPGTSSAARKTASSGVEKSDQPSRPPPDDLDLVPLEKALGCGGKDATGPCHVVQAAKACKPWSGLAPSGDGRWFGKSYAVESGKTTESYVILRSRTVPSGDVGEGQLPARIALDPIAVEGTMADAAARTLRAYEHHDVPTKGNPFPPLITGKTDFTESPAMPTTKKSIVVLSDVQMFVCEGDGQELLAIAPKTGSANKGDGRYAEVWPSSW